MARLSIERGSASRAAQHRARLGARERLGVEPARRQRRLPWRAQSCDGGRWHRAARA